jgi:hypothetical protein
VTLRTTSETSPDVAYSEQFHQRPCWELLRSFPKRCASVPNLQAHPEGLKTRSQIPKGTNSVIPTLLRNRQQCNNITYT